jgi:hypothetical protein
VRRKRLDRTGPGSDLVCEWVESHLPGQLRANSSISAGTHSAASYSTKTLTLAPGQRTGAALLQLLLGQLSATVPLFTCSTRAGVLGGSEGTQEWAERRRVLWCSLRLNMLSLKPSSRRQQVPWRSCCARSGPPTASAS